MEVAGRIKIFTDEKEITRENIIPVLQKAYAKHRFNARKIQFLLDYERGEQPLKRNKIIRKEIDIRTCDNLANQIKEFKVGYFWGTPAMMVQRGNNEPHSTDTNTDDNGITALNEMLKNGNFLGRIDQELAEYCEIGGIGHRIVDIKTDFESKKSIDTYVNLYTLDSRNAFCVYRNGVGQKKVLGVTFSKSNSGKLAFTCFTDKMRYEISNGEIKREEINPLGMIPIVEYERAVDRTGCFERQIPLMDNLNIMVSDFANLVCQKTQEIWWGNDIDFPKDKSGNDVKPQSGQWVLTYSGGDGKNPKIQPLSSDSDSTATLTAIANTRTKILQNCKIPIQYDNSGGGSTGVATDLSAGWTATEVDAIREQQMIESGKREELNLILKAIEFVPTKILPVEHPLRKIHSTDIDFHFNRRKNYDMVSKANALSTLLAHGIQGRHAIQFIDGFPDTQQVWNDSKELIEKFQENAFGIESKNIQYESEGRLGQDLSDQISQSPIVDGLNADKNRIEN